MCLLVLQAAASAVDSALDQYRPWQVAALAACAAVLLTAVVQVSM